MTFSYVGKQRFLAVPKHGFSPDQVDTGWLWQDYHHNRQIYVRPLGRGNYQLAIFVNGSRTTDEITTRGKIQTYVENNHNFQIHDNIFDAMV